MIRTVVEQPDASLSIDIMSIAELVLNCIHMALELQAPGPLEENRDRTHRLASQTSQGISSLWPSGLLGFILWLEVHVPFPATKVTNFWMGGLEPHASLSAGGCAI